MEREWEAALKDFQAEVSEAVRVCHGFPPGHCAKVQAREREASK